MDTITILVPSVTAFELAPNPADFNAALAVRLTVTEVSVTLEPIWFFCGEIYSGEG